MVISFARLFLFALLVCSVAIFLLLVVTHNAPLANFDTGFTPCDVPCLAGIAPGRTRFEDTADMVVVRFPGADLSLLDNRVDFNVPSARLGGILHARQGVVDNIQVNVSQPLWAALLTLGVPQCIQYIDRQLASGLVNIFWTINDVHVMANANLAHAGPTVMTNVFQLWLSPPESPCMTSDNVAPWPGFFALR